MASWDSSTTEAKQLKNLKECEIESVIMNELLHYLLRCSRGQGWIIYRIHIF